MGFKEVSSLDADNTVALGGMNRKTGKKNPTQVEGYYLGHRRVESKKSKDGYALIHFLQTPKGNLGVWGKTDLDRKLTAVTPGTMIRATHTGMQATPNGEMYKYKVEVDSDNTIEVEGLQAVNSAPAYEDPIEASSYESSDDTEDEGEQDEDSYSDRAPAASFSASAAERKAKVDALLKNRVKKA